MNITVDLSELFVAAQNDAMEDAEIDHDHGQSWVRDFGEITLKDAVQDKIIQQCTADVDRSAMLQAVNRLSLNEVNLDKRFDSIVKQNIESSIAKKVNEWVYTGIVDSGDKEYLVSDLIKTNLKKSIDDINNKYSVNSFESMLTKMINEKVSTVVSNYESMIKEEVDMAAKSIIQEKVSETLTSTFAHMMQFNESNLLTKG